MTAEITITLPTNVSTTLSTFIAAAKKAFGDQLISVVLYGSGAEGKLRPTSDVNLILLLSAFDRGLADQLREPLRLAQAAIKLRVMFLLEEELKPASQSFAVKFADITRRRLILYGEDPFASISVSRADAISILKQRLLNLTLRLREAYIVRSLREEQLAAVIADAAGPLRSCASTLLELEGRPAPTPREALEQFANSSTSSAHDVQLITEARQRHALPPGAAAPALFHLIELAHAMWARAAEL
ncbi:MAG TPA: nucleotidyltransferase domain-containing protein [Pyrinomonadaceae bacterium]|nr:nucleotidyltransferase domain-containing protein [Pyrinomonadaceae bacterium]